MLKGWLMICGFSLIFSNYSRCRHLFSLTELNLYFILLPSVLPPDVFVDFCWIWFHLIGDDAMLFHTRLFPLSKFFNWDAVSNTGNFMDDEDGEGSLKRRHSFSSYVFSYTYIGAWLVETIKEWNEGKYEKNK